MAAFMDDKDTADVTFLVGEQDSEDKETITAHKSILAFNSEVFHGMFYGALPLQQPVVVNDCSPKAFKLTLRYIYLDEFRAPLDVSELVPLVYLANKYMLHGLMDKAAKWLSTELEPSSICAIVPYLYLLRDEDVSLFWNYAERHGEAVIVSEKFLDLTTEQLSGLLSRSLQAPALAVYERTIEWGKRQCEKSSTEASIANVRAAITHAFCKIKFSGMTLQEFRNGPASDDYLNSEEKIEIFMSISGNSGPGMQVCTRYTHRAVTRVWNYPFENISFTVNKAVTVFGVGVYGPALGNPACEITVNLQNGQEVLQSKKMVLPPGCHCPKPVMFCQPVEVRANTEYVVSLKVSGSTYYGDHGQPEIAFDTARGNVIFKFSQPANGGWTCTGSGQIPEIYFA